MNDAQVRITQPAPRTSEQVGLQCRVFTAVIYAVTCLILQETAYAQPSGRRVRFPFYSNLNQPPVFSMFSGGWFCLILVILQARR